MLFMSFLNNSYPDVTNYVCKELMHLFGSYIFCTLFNNGHCFLLLYFACLLCPSIKCFEKEISSSSLMCYSGSTSAPDVVTVCQLPMLVQHRKNDMSVRCYIVLTDQHESNLFQIQN